MLRNNRKLNKKVAQVEVNPNKGEQNQVQETMRAATLLLPLTQPLLLPLTQPLTLPLTQPLLLPLTQPLTLPLPLALPQKVHRSPS